MATAPHDTARLVQLRMQQCASALNDLAAMVNRIQPRAHVVLELPGVPPFTDLAVADLFLEERRVANGGFVDSSFMSSSNARYDYLLLSFEYRGPHTHVVVRDSPPEIERLEWLLQHHRVRFDMDASKNARAQIERATFRIDSAIKAGVKVIADYDSGLVRFALRNLGRLTENEAQFWARDLTQPVFDELGRCIVGLPNDFLKAAAMSTGTSTTPSGPFSKF